MFATLDDLNRLGFIPEALAAGGVIDAKHAPLAKSFGIKSEDREKRKALRNQLAESQALAAQTEAELAQAARAYAQAARDATAAVGALEGRYPDAAQGLRRELDRLLGTALGASEALKGGADVATAQATAATLNGLQAELRRVARGATEVLRTEDARARAEAERYAWAVAQAQRAAAARASGRHVDEGLVEHLTAEALESLDRPGAFQAAMRARLEDVIGRVEDVTGRVNPATAPWFASQATPWAALQGLPSARPVVVWPPAPAPAGGLGFIQAIAPLIGVAASVAVPMLAAERSRKDGRKSDKRVAQQQALALQAAQQEADRRRQHQLTLFGLGVAAAGGYMLWQIAREKPRGRRRR